MDHLDWSVKKFEALLPTELYRLLQLREEVFVLEQECLYRDLDDKDPVSLHVQGRDPQNNRLAAYARIIPPGVTFAEPCISRVVTAAPYRGLALGKALMRHSIHAARENYPGLLIRISAQAHLQRFYRGFGFVPEGHIYLEDGIDHIAMVLPKPTPDLQDVPLLDLHTHHRDQANDQDQAHNQAHDQTRRRTTAIYNLRGDEVHPLTTSNSLVSAGIHPWDLVPERLDIQLQQLEEAAADPRVVLIGECGLDKLRGPALRWQSKAFAEQLRLADRHHKPVIIHCVRAYDELIRIRKELRPEIPMIIHGFHRTPQLARQLTGQGFLLSFGAASFHKKNQFTETLQQLLADELPFFLETDDSPMPIEEIYDRTAILLKISVDQLKDLIFASWKKIGLKNG